MEAVYSARATSREQTKTSLAPIKLRRNEHGRATHEDTEAWIGQVDTTLGEIVNAHDPPNGMRGILKTSADDPIAGIKTTTFNTRESIIAGSAAEAKDKNARKVDNREDWTAVFGPNDHASTRPTKRSSAPRRPRATPS